MPNKILCTVAVLTKNSAETLARALESAKEFAEIIVCDGGSTDRTLDIAVWVDRKYEIDGEVIERAATYPTRQMRLFHKSAVTEFIKPIHERINPKTDVVIVTTKNFMLVPVSSDPRVWREKWKHYIELEVFRRGKISVWQWLGVCLENLKISILFAIRFLRYSLFSRGSKMPLSLEWERHVYHFNLCRALLTSTI